MKICNVTESNKKYITILKKANNKAVFKATADAVEEYLLQEGIPFEGDVNIDLEVKTWVMNRLFTSIYLPKVPYEWLICRPETSVSINSYFFYKHWVIDVDGMPVDITITCMCEMPKEDLELYKSLGKVHLEETVKIAEALYCES